MSRILDAACRQALSTVYAHGSLKFRPLLTGNLRDHVSPSLVGRTLFGSVARGRWDDLTFSEQFEHALVASMLVDFAMDAMGSAAHPELSPVERAELSIAYRLYRENLLARRPRIEFEDFTWSHIPEVSIDGTVALARALVSQALSVRSAA